MAPMIQTSQSHYENGNFLGTNRFSELGSVIRKSGPATGQWLDIGGGNKFRASTHYWRMSAWTEPGGPEHSIGYIWDPRNVFEWKTSSGGCGIGIVLNNNHAYTHKFNGSSYLDPPDIRLNERNEAVTEALNQIADSKAGMGENLGTLAQTARMLKSPVSGLVGGIRAIRRDSFIKDFVGPSYRDMRRRGIAKSIADKYLEYVYGLVPLMSDIHGIVELMKESGQGPLLLKGQGSSRSSPSGSISDVYDHSFRKRSIVTLDSSSNRVRCTLWATPDPDWTAVRMLNRLGLLNPAQIAWELVPYSFLIDWVLPIGPVLSALTAPVGLNFVDGSISKRSSGTLSYTIQQHGSGTVTGGHPGTGMVRYEGYKRDSIREWPLPGFYFDSDPLRLSVDGSDRVLKALALSISRL